MTEDETSDNPLGMLTNLFDVAMVFAVALMVALVAHFNMSEIFSKEDYTIVKNPGAENMEIIMKEGNKVKYIRATDIYTPFLVGAEAGYLISGVNDPDYKPEDDIDTSKKEESNG